MNYKRFFRVGFLMALLGTMASATVSVAITSDERAAVVVVDLTTYAKPELKWFYQLAEAFAVGQSYVKLKGTYKRLFVLSGPAATYDGLETWLTGAAKQPGTKAIDVYIHLHGSPGGLSFNEGTHPSSELREKLKGKGQRKFRAVYSAACFGTTHADDWLGGGFTVANGARLVNANTLYDLPTFLGAWRGGVSFGDAQRLANHPFWRGFYDTIANRLGMGEADSHKEVHGREETAIGDVPAYRAPGTPLAAADGTWAAMENDFRRGKAPYRLDFAHGPRELDEAFIGEAFPDPAWRTRWLHWMESR